MNQEHFEGQRLSFDDALCTVRYIGEVQGTKGTWLGVEWDDPSRGKHSGEHQGVRYFTCLNKLPTAGSFVRPSRPSERPRSFLEALREKYASEAELLAKRNLDGLIDGLPRPIQIGSKVAEEVGFDKIRKQLAALHELKVVLLDGMRVHGVLSGDRDTPQQLRQELDRIERTCPMIRELDLGWNLLRDWKDIESLTTSLTNLKTLKLSANRFRPSHADLKVERVEDLSLDETLLEPAELSDLTFRFPSLKSLSASMNQLTSISTPLSSTITKLNLEYNEFDSLESVRPVLELPHLVQLSLRGNCIKGIEPLSLSSSTQPSSSSPVTHLDISHNVISSWTSINHLPHVFPGLTSLRISDNPLFDQAVGPSGVTKLPEKAMTADEAFMLTLARLGNLQMLNYGKITRQDRSNGEMYYLSLIGKELSASAESEEKAILANHPRYAALCETYGPPLVQRAVGGGSGALNPRSLAARLVTVTFRLSATATASPSPPPTGASADAASQETLRTAEIPLTFDTYRIRALAARLFSLSPLRFRLVWETEEWDPEDETRVGEDEWDSSDEDGDGDNIAGTTGPASLDQPVKEKGGNKLVRRQVELVESTRDVGFWFSDDVRHATVRVELL